MMSFLVVELIIIVVPTQTFYFKFKWRKSFIAGDIVVIFPVAIISIERLPKHNGVSCSKPLMEQVGEAE